MVVKALVFVNKPQKVAVRPSDKLATHVTTDMYLTFIGTHLVLYKSGFHVNISLLHGIFTSKIKHG